ncbi:phosphoserine phosphatase SerB [Limibaculum sp. FT325]|uniref:phosphoserine phosphatase SerB n=1 Tax=Thermohalobaculum sediminis TaxID=2939436 RepID=UPI0020C0BB3A|nr:phosphoserine phosphatase SerB [Limibaculum sediminis]MCL5777869.1 phosphoserine phosphatase SerB [Limibaculum sediminis]
MAGVAVVLTAPRARGLTDAEIAVAARAADGDGPRRLGPAAAEIAAGTAPDLAALAAALPGVDVNAVPLTGRRKRILIADMDSTLIPVECIDEIADVAGVKPQVAAITERAMAGEIDFEGSLRARVRLLAGLPEAALARVHAERVSLNPGASALVRTMRAAGARTLLVSGGFTYFAERVAEAAGFSEARANVLLARDGLLTGEVAEPILGREAKLDALREAAAALGVGAEAVLAVGDGANDLAMIEAAGLGVGFRPKPALAARSDAVICHAGLDALLALQGYSEDEIVGL